jgi:predicted glycosyltransferase
MKKRPVIGLYVHHHGSGHATRAKQIIDSIDAEVHVLTSATKHFDATSTDYQLVTLPMDVPERRTARMSFDTPDVFHYAPTNVKEVRNRMAKLTQWAVDTQPDLVVVDLSCEATQLFRLLSIPTVVVRLHGYREDVAHEQAFKSAEFIIAPFPKAVEDGHTPNWIREKTVYTGFFSRYINRELSREEAQKVCSFDTDRLNIVLINGTGGHAFRGEQLYFLAETYPQHDWTVVGTYRSAVTTPPLPNLRTMGHVEDTFPYLRAADVVVGSAGTNTMMEIATADARYICLPEYRPFEEQVCKAQALEKLQAGIINYQFPQLQEWNDLLERALALPNDRWATFKANRNFQQVVQRIEQQAQADVFPLTNRVSRMALAS